MPRRDNKMPKNNSELEFSKELSAKETNIPGVIVFDLPVHGDSRGWFKENYQKEKMTKLGLPEINIVQNNISFNADKGVTRGFHAEPWDKYISVATGKVFGAWVDLRPGDTFGETFTTEIDPSKAIFIPRGVANAFQALEDKTAYTYLVNAHWSAEAQSEYTFVNLADETLNIKWPIPLELAELSEKDKNHPRLPEVKPMTPRRTLVVGANGQLGRALQIKFPDAEFAGHNELDITSPDLCNVRNWNQYDTIINAAAFTAVDKAETPEGREAAWKVNAEAVANLAKIAIKYSNITLVQISSDYVFDGNKIDHTEDEPFTPLNVYGQTKAAADIVVSATPKHYIARTSWVVGDGNNFVKTMKSLAEKGIKPSVVNDQIGRLTFADDLADAIKHLVSTKASYGTYNVTSDGHSTGWADIAAEVYRLTGHDGNDVTGVSTLEYYAGKQDIATRPLQSSLNLDKIKSTGFKPLDGLDGLKNYLNSLEEK